MGLQTEPQIRKRVHPDTQRQCYGGREGIPTWWRRGSLFEDKGKLFSRDKGIAELRMSRTERYPADFLQKANEPTFS